MRIDNMNQISQPIYNRGTYPKSNDGFSGVLNESEDKVKGEGDFYIPQDSRDIHMDSHDEIRPFYESSQIKETEHYKIMSNIVTEHTIGDFSILNKRTNNRIYFDLEDLKIQTDNKTGGKFLISSVDRLSALQVDEELEDFLRNIGEVLGTEVKTQPLTSHTVYESEYGIKTLVRNYNGETYQPDYTEENLQAIDKLARKYKEFYQAGGETLQDWQANYLAKEEAVGTQMLTDNGMIVQAGNTVQFIGRDLEEKWSVKVGGTDANPFKLMALLLNYREIRGYWKNRIFGRIKES